MFPGLAVKAPSHSVAVVKVRPFIAWLEKAYRDLRTVAEITEVPYETLCAIANGTQDTVASDVALRIITAIAALRHGDRSFSIYENEASPHFASEEEKALPRDFSRWRAAGRG